MKKVAVVLVVITLVTVLLSACTQSTPQPQAQTPQTGNPAPSTAIKSTPPSGTSGAPTLQVPATTNIPTQVSKPTPTRTAFPIIKSGEGQAYLKKPLFFSGWTNNDKFFDQIPQVAANWAPALPGNPAEQNWFISYVNNHLKRNQHYIGASITPMHEIGNNFSAKPELACIDIDGKPITVQKPGMGNYMANQYWMNLLDPGWQKMLLDNAKKMIDMGVEGISVDESIFNQQVIFKAGGSFDKYSMDGFRAYLKNKYTAQELAGKFQISNIESFNLKDYLIQNNLKDTWNKEEWPPIPITYEFGTFQIGESVKFWRSFSQEIKTYAKEKYGREMFLSLSGAPEFANAMMPGDFQDYLTGEHFYFQNSWSVAKAATVIKMSEGLAPTLAVLVEVAHDRGTIPQQTKNMFKYIFADIYSANGKMITDGDYFKTMTNWSYNDDKKVAYDVAEAAKYVAYANAHPELYSLKEPAQVAVVHSVATRRAHMMNPYIKQDGTSEGEIKGITDMLLNLNIPFNNIVSGDGEIITSTFKAGDLAGYRVVVLPVAVMLSNEEISALLDYVKNGGTVVSTGQFGTYDKNANKINPAELQPLRDAGEHALGKGKWFTIGDYLGGQYYGGDSVNRAFDPKERDFADAPLVTLKNAITKYYTPEIETDAPITVNIRRYADGARTVLHLVNYNYDQTKDAFTPAGPFTVTVTLPAGASPTGAVLYNFETAKEETLEVAVNNGKAKLTIPSLYAYVIVEIK